MQITMIKNGSTLEAPGPWEADVLNELGDGEFVMVNLNKDLNPAFFRKFWSLIRWAWDNTEHNQASEHCLKDYLFLRAHLVNTIVMHDGTVRYTPLSCSPERIKDVKEFQRFYDAVLAEVASLISADPDQLSRMIEQYG